MRPDARAQASGAPRRAKARERGHRLRPGDAPEHEFETPAIRQPVRGQKYDHEVADRAWPEQILESKKPRAANLASTPTSGANPRAESARCGLSIDALQRGVLDNLVCLQARTPGIATPYDW